MHTIDFDLDREHVELNQLLKLVGIADSGGQGKAIVASGEVRWTAWWNCGRRQRSGPARSSASAMPRSGCWASRARHTPLLGSTPLYSQQASALSPLVGA